MKKFVVAALVVAASFALAPGADAQGFPPGIVDCTEAFWAGASPACNTPTVDSGGPVVPYSDHPLAHLIDCDELAWRIACGIPEATRPPVIRGPVWIVA